MNMPENMHLIETVNYPNGGKSFFYLKEDTVFIIDKNIWEISSRDQSYPYSLITNKQNEYIFRYSRVFRCIEEDFEDLVSYIDSNDSDCNINNIQDRGESLEASILEMKFEDCFSSAYGTNYLDCLDKEYCISDGNNRFFLDYVLEKNGQKFAIEENGVTYHHPQIIGKEKYRKQLRKQNICAKWGFKLFRFSSEDCNFEGRIEDDIKRFFGDNPEAFKVNGLYANRAVKLYEHQQITLDEIEQQRNLGIKTFLSVLPTASGKSRIIEEDIRRYCTDINDKVLILCPTTDIILDWKRRIRKSLSDMTDQIDVFTYSYSAINLQKYSTNHYSYIVVDEAHHAVVPTLKRVIQYFDPKFLIGITATDKRLDSQKLETVFGSYKTQLSLQEAMEKGIIAKANVYRLETNIDLSKIRFNGKDYVNADLEKTIRVNSRNELIANVIKEYFCDNVLKNKQGVIFCVNHSHTLEIAKLMRESGISCESYTGYTKNSADIMNDFKNGKIRFLAACNKISEGWDFPELGIIVMARPTMSKVLYLQQIGRGLRKTDEKSNVFIIDVVDEYGSMIKPCSMHSIFQNPYYVNFGDITKRDYVEGEFVEVDSIKERIERIVEIDINTFEDRYGDYLNQEQLAREYYVNTNTIISWIKSGKISADKSFSFGSRTIYLFSLESVNRIRNQFSIKKHDDSTIYDDFFDFIKERDYTLSYKMPFILGVINNVDSIGDVKIDSILDYYIDFYKDRLNKGLALDRKTCPYNKDNLNDRKFILNSMLTNPFEKFERKRFLHYSKDLGIISFNHALFARLSSTDLDTIKNQINEDIKSYYASI